MGNKPNSSMLSRELVTNSMTNPPARINELRRAMETPAPTTDWTRVVSVVSLDSTSPDLVTSKNVGSIRITCWYTAERISATTRSPIHITV